MSSEPEAKTAAIELHQSNEHGDCSPEKTEKTDQSSVVVDAIVEHKEQKLENKEEEEKEAGAKSEEVKEEAAAPDTTEDIPAKSGQAVKESTGEDHVSADPLAEKPDSDEKVTEKCEDAEVIERIDEVIAAAEEEASAVEVNAVEDAKIPDQDAKIQDQDAKIQDQDDVDPPKTDEIVEKEEVLAVNGHVSGEDTEENRTVSEEAVEAAPDAGGEAAPAKQEEKPIQDLLREVVSEVEGKSIMDSHESLGSSKASSEYFKHTPIFIATNWKGGMCPQIR